MREAIYNNTIVLPSAERLSATRLTLTLLFFGDLLVLLLAVLFSFICRFTILLGYDWESSLAMLAAYQLHLSLACLSMLGLLYFRESYALKQLARYRYGSIQMQIVAFYWSVGFLCASLFFEIDPAISRVWVAICGLSFGLGLAGWRYVFCRHLVGHNLLENIRRKTLVIGWNAQAAKLYERAEASNKGGHFFPFRVDSVVLLEESQSEESSSYPKNILKGTGCHDLEAQLLRHQHDTVILANSNLPRDCVLRIQEICGREMIDFMIIPDFVHTLCACLRIESQGGIPMLTQNAKAINQTFNSFIKRLFDIAGSVIGLTLSAPIIAYFCWRVYQESPGPVFYKQIRLGEHGKAFEIIKIRSMRLDAEERTGAKWCTEGDPRRLKVGAFMRKYNIDELPQFWNVLKGDMSLVGPRPERPELIWDFKHEISFYNVRHLVKPGITGWAQVNGWRGDTCLQSRVACDIEYIERWSIWFDFYICLRTLWSNKNAY